MNVRANPDYAPITLRRVALLQDRLELIYYSLYVTILLCFLAIMVALHLVRKDILKELKK
jgi:hypothetical protein